MTTDACTRIWLGDSPWGGVPQRHERREYLDASPAAHTQAMAPIDRSIVMGYRADRINARIDAGMVLSFAAQSALRRFPVIGIDPTSNNALAEAQNAAKSDAIGINLSPGDQGVRPTDERVVVLLELCARTDLVVFVNNPGLGAPGCVLEWTDPALFDEAARTIAGLRLVFGDLGRVYTEQTLAMLAKHKGVFATTDSLVAGSWKLRRTLVECYELGVCEKLLFASGFPRMKPEAAIEMIYGVSTSAGGGASVPRETLRRIIERDTFSALGITNSDIVIKNKTRVVTEVERANS